MNNDIVRLDPSDNKYYDHYDQPPKEEDLINKVIPKEVLKKILSNLGNKDTSSAFKVCKHWKTQCQEVVGKRKLDLIKEIATILSEKLDKNKYKEQVDKLTNLSSSKTSFRNIPLVNLKAKISNVKKNIKEILETISPDDLDKLFDSLKIDKKLKLCSEFVPLSTKYKTLHDELKWCMAQSPTLERAEALLEAGVKPTTEILNSVLKLGACSDKVDFFELVEAFLEGGAKPTTESLNLAVRKEYYDEEAFRRMLKAFLDKGVIPTTETLNLAILYCAPLEFLKELLKAGAKPTTMTLGQAICGSLELLKVLLEAGAKPTEIILNEVISNRHNTLNKVKLLLEHGAVPTNETLLHVITFHASLEVLKELLKAGVEPTTDFLKTAMFALGRGQVSQEHVTMLFEYSHVPRDRIWN